MDILIRSDAGPSIGAGHVMRMLALAQAAQDRRLEVGFVVCECNEALISRIKNEGFELIQFEGVTIGSQEDSERTISHIESNQVSWAVLDGYRFNCEFQDALIESGVQLAVIDDTGHCDSYSGQLIVNQNCYATSDLYQGIQKDTQVLLGSDFVMLRREFRRAGNRVEKKMRYKAEQVSNVLVTIGGADSRNLSSKILEALNRWRGRCLRIRVVAGMGYSREDLERVIAESPHEVTLVEQTDQMVEELLWADSAITAAGSTIWECAFMRVPFAFVVLAQNQLRNGIAMSEMGLAVSLGTVGEEKFEICLDEGLNQFLSDSGDFRGGELLTIDGKGADRVLDAMFRAALGLRRVCLDDCRVLFEWANDPLVRSLSFCQDEIAWNTHVEWFESCLEDEQTWIYIATSLKGSLVGQIRFVRSNDGVLVGLSIDAEFRGKGMAVDLITMGLEQLQATSLGGEAVHAWIKLSNKASQKAFRRAGFVRRKNQDYRGTESAHYVWEPGATL